MEKIAPLDIQMPPEKCFGGPNARDQCILLMLGSRTSERETSCIKNDIDQWLFAIGVEPIWKEREGPQQIRDPTNFEEIRLSLAMATNLCVSNMWPW